MKITDWKDCIRNRPKWKEFVEKAETKKQKKKRPLCNWDYELAFDGQRTTFSHLLFQISVLYLFKNHNIDRKCLYIYMYVCMCIYIYIYITTPVWQSTAF